MSRADFKAESDAPPFPVLAATKESQPRISRMARMKKDGFPIRPIRPTRGKKSSRFCPISCMINNATKTLMKPSCKARILMMDAIYKECSGAKPEARKQLVEGIFWLVETIQEDIRHKNAPGLLHASANVAALKDIAEPLLIDPTRHIDTKPFSSACVKALMSMPI
jgi:hypothetical protein